MSKKYRETFNKLENIVKRTLENSPRCHDWDHTLRVLRNARMLSEYENKCNIKVIELAALFHDIARADELAIQGKICHAKKGAEITKEILAKENLDDQLISKVVKCIRRHRSKGSEMPVTTEDKIVYDADKLDSLGAIGLGRAFVFAGRIGAKVHNTALEAINSKPYSVNDTAYREYLTTIRHIPSRMMTKTGEKIAKRRLKFMEKFFDVLNKETIEEE